MLTFWKKTYEAPQNTQKWLYILRLRTDNRSIWFKEMRDDLKVEKRSYEKWFGKVDQMGGQFNLVARNAGLFKYSAFKVKGKVKDDGTIKVSYGFNWTIFIDLVLPFLLIQIMSAGTDDWVKTLLIGCVGILWILVLVWEFNKIENRLIDSIEEASIQS